MSHLLPSRILLFISCFVFLSSCQSPKDDWTPLFNGKDLDNFVVLNGTATYHVEDQAIVGVTKENTPNTFLTNGEKYSDFILEYDVWADVNVNSGVQFRSISDTSIDNGRVHGYQCEIESSDRKWAGGIYEEARRGWLYPLSVNKAGQKAFKRDQWNHYRIEAIGSQIRTWVNGIPCANLVDDMTPAGIIAFQVHGIGNAKEAGREIKWKNMRIKTQNLEAERMPMPADTREVSYLKNKLTEQEKVGGWKLLWDGKTFTGWQDAKSMSTPTSGWKIESGELTVLASDGKESSNQDLITTKKYADFELELEFNYTEGANSGIKYYVDPELNQGDGSEIGLEFQILDDKRHPDAKAGKNGNRTIASLYDLIPAGNLSESNRNTKREAWPDSWNKARIVSQNGQVEHWLNNVLVLRYDRFSDAFRALVAESKYRKWPTFGELPQGHILLQEHGNEVHFRSIKIREL